MLPLLLIALGLCLAVIALVLVTGRMDRKERAVRRAWDLKWHRATYQSAWDREVTLYRARRERALRRESIQLEPTPLGKQRVGLDPPERRAA